MHRLKASFIFKKQKIVGARQFQIKCYMLKILWYVGRNVDRPTTTKIFVETFHAFPKAPLKAIGGRNSAGRNFAGPKSMLIEWQSGLNNFSS